MELKEWCRRILASAGGTTEADLPGFPPAPIQERFVGRSGPAAIEEVIPFFEAIVDRASPDADTAILDFGAGWGRIARLFQVITTHERLYLADVDPEALEWCRQCGVAGVPLLLEPNGVLPLSENSLDVVYSYSVFSHLAEHAARHWFAEIGRTLKPGGLFVFTTGSLRFLELVRACHEKPNPNQFEAMIGRYMGSDPYLAIRRYQHGLHTYSDTGGGGMLSGEFYGWAAIPPKWFDAEVGHLFELEAHVDDRSMSEQAVYITRRRP